MDEEHLPPLGPAKPWLVKDFPISLREDITRAAAGQGVTVGQWLVAHFQKHGVGGVEITRAYPTPVNPGNPRPVAALPAPGTDRRSELRELVEMARELTPPDKDTRVMQVARAAVLDRLKALRAG